MAHIHRRARVNSGVLSSGEVVALYNYMSQILIELIKFASLIINITKSVACARRIGDILEISGSEHTGSMPMKKGGDIEFKNVSLRYDEAGDNTLTNISFKVKSGQTVGIIGGTGSGKSSLTNLIPAFYRASSGEILINGQNINDIDTDSHSEKMLPSCLSARAVFRHNPRQYALGQCKSHGRRNIQSA